MELTKTFDMNSRRSVDQTDNRMDTQRDQKVCHRPDGRILKRVAETECKKLKTDVIVVVMILRWSNSLYIITSAPSRLA